jgi:hypothetical protein
MNSAGKLIAMASLGCSITMMFGCAPSISLVDVWRDPLYQAPPFAKMLVIDIGKDAARRRMWEDAFTGELGRHGVAATSSYRFFPNDPPDTNQVIAVAQADSFDGILVVRGLPSEKSLRYVPGYTTKERGMNCDSYWERYGACYREIDYVGYVDSETVGIRAIDIVTTGKNSRMIWSGTSKTPDPDSAPDLQRKVAGLIMSELVRHGIIRPKK